MIQRMKIIFVFAFALIASCAYAVTSANLESFDTDVVIGQEVIVRVRVSETTLKKVNFTFAEPPSGARRMELKKYVDSQSAAADVIIEAVFIFDEAKTFELPPVVVKSEKTPTKSRFRLYTFLKI